MGVCVCLEEQNGSPFMSLHKYSLWLNLAVLFVSDLLHLCGLTAPRTSLVLRMNLLQFFDTLKIAGAGARASSPLHFIVKMRYFRRCLHPQKSSSPPPGTPYTCLTPSYSFYVQSMTQSLDWPFLPCWYRYTLQPPPIRGENAPRSRSQSHELYFVRNFSALPSNLVSRREKNHSHLGPSSTAYRVKIPTIISVLLRFSL